MTTFTALVLWAIGGTLFYLAMKLGIQIAKYNFENRSNSGVVEFNDYNAVIKQNGKKMLVFFLGLFSAGFILAAIVFTVGVFSRT